MPFQLWTIKVTNINKVKETKHKQNYSTNPNYEIK